MQLILVQTEKSEPTVTSGAGINVKRLHPNGFSSGVLTFVVSTGHSLTAIKCLYTFIHDAHKKSLAITFYLAPSSGKHLNWSSVLSHNLNDSLMPSKLVVIFILTFIKSVH